MRLLLATIIVFVLVFSFAGCNNKSAKVILEEFSGNKLPEWNKQLTDIIITDVFTPPVSSRIYAYCNIASYEALVAAYPYYSSFAGKLNGLKEVPRPKDITDTSYFAISSILAFTTVAQKLVFNADAMKQMEADYLEQIDDLSLDEVLKQKSIDYGRKVGEHILDWSKSDGYLQRNAHPGYIVTSEPASWQPTPPDYMDAVEPNWGTLRPFIMDSSSVFRPLMAVQFDTMS